MRNVVPGAGIKGRAKKLHLTISVGCNYLSMPLIPASGWTLLIYAMGNFKVKSTSLYGKQLPVNQRASLDCSVMITPSLLFLAATKQLYIHFCLSDCLSVCLSHLFHNVCIIVSSWNLQGLLPLAKLMSMQKVKVKGLDHRGQKTFCPQFGHFWTLTPV